MMSARDLMIEKGYIGSDISSIFAEGEAKFNEDLVSREAFGMQAYSHYIRAMRTKLAGRTLCTDLLQKRT